MAEHKKILFLYAHVQPFLLSGISRLVNNYQAEVMIVCWPKTDIAPTDITTHDKVAVYYKTDGNSSEIKKTIQQFAPDIIYSVGWMDRDYLRWCLRFRKAGKITIMAMDTQWRGTLKQRINTLAGSVLLRTIFRYAWVPGPRQHEYASKLGFDDTHILDNLCSPDTDLFKSAYERYLPRKKQQYPKAFLYVGRLVEHKFGPLFKAFTGLTEQERNGWKLIVAGKGPMENQLTIGDDAVVYKGFLQQEKLVELVGEAGVFCLLSTEEPWGTVIQEFAAAGMPVLASIQCGATPSFVKDGLNGYSCDATNEDTVKACLLKMINTSGDELLAMSAQSVQMAAPINSDVWAKTLMSTLNDQTSNYRY